MTLLLPHQEIYVGWKATTPAEQLGEPAQNLQLKFAPLLRRRMWIELFPYLKLGFVLSLCGRSLSWLTAGFFGGAHHHSTWLPRVFVCRGRARALAFPSEMCSQGDTDDLGDA